MISWTMTKKKIRLKSFFDDFKEDMRNPEFRRGVAEEYRKLELSLAVIRLRKGRKLTQAQLAKKLKTNQSAIARLESGRENVTIETLSKIAVALKKRLVVRFV